MDWTRAGATAGAGPRPAVDGPRAGLPVLAAGRRKSRAISLSMASILAAVSIASERANSRLGIAFRVDEERGEVEPLRPSGRGLPSGLPTDLTCGLVEERPKVTPEDEREPPLPRPALSLGSFLKNEKTTVAL